MKNQEAGDRSLAAASLRRDGTTCEGQSRPSAPSCVTACCSAFVAGERIAPAAGQTCCCNLEKSIAIHSYALRFTTSKPAVARRWMCFIRFPGLSAWHPVTRNPEKSRLPRTPLPAAAWKRMLFLNLGSQGFVSLGYLGITPPAFRS